MKLLRISDRRWINVEQVTTVSVTYRSAGADPHAQVMIHMVDGQEVPFGKVVSTAEADANAERLVDAMRQVAPGRYAEVTA